jgi:hypothetical protein
LVVNADSEIYDGDREERRKTWDAVFLAWAVSLIWPN